MDKEFKIEIWQYHCIVDIYESDNIEEVLEWYRENWIGCYLNGGCAYEVYKNGKMLLFEEIYKLGFED